MKAVPWWFPQAGPLRYHQGKSAGKQFSENNLDANVVMRLPTSMDFDRIHSHQPGPTSAQQKRNQHSTHQCSLCSRSLQKSAQVPCRNLNNSCINRRFSSWRPVVSRADVWDIGFASDQMLGATKIAQLEDSRLGIKQKILEEKCCSWFSALNNQVTWGLMSLWQMPFEWMYARDLGVNKFHTCSHQNTWRIIYTINLKSWYM